MTTTTTTTQIEALHFLREVLPAQVDAGLHVVAFFHGTCRSCKTKHTRTAKVLGNWRRRKVHLEVKGQARQIRYSDNSWGYSWLIKCPCGDQAVCSMTKGVAL